MAGAPPADRLRGPDRDFAVRARGGRLKRGGRQAMPSGSCAGGGSAMRRSPAGTLLRVIAAILIGTASWVGVHAQTTDASMEGAASVTNISSASPGVTGVEAPA